MTLHVSDRVAAALTERRPVVALESTVVTHGLPYPQNLRLARDLEAVVRDEGAVPATIGVLDGRLVVGVDDADLVRLAEAGRDGAADKASLWNLAAIVAQQRMAGTTVATTLHAAAAAGIEVFATGGIGGVHPPDEGAAAALPGGAARRTGPATVVRDESADLHALARYPVTTICAGPKSLLDAAATLERLETLGVPVVGYGTERLAGFLAEPLDLDVPAVADTPGAVARIALAHRRLGRPGGPLVCRPVEAPLPRASFDAWLAEARAAAARAGVRGKAVTPFLLRELAERSDGATVEVNLRLLAANARLAARVAAALVAADDASDSAAPTAPPPPLAGAPT